MATNMDTRYEPMDGVSSRVAQLQSSDSALMRQASAAGMRGANRRGLANSSMGIGAGINATLSAVTPIASQESSQAQQRGLAGMEDRRMRDLSTAQIASQDRGNEAQVMASLGRSYTDGMATSLNNEKIPGDVRSRMQSDIAGLYRAQQDRLASLFGGSLSWGGSAQPTTVPPPAMIAPPNRGVA